MFTGESARALDGITLGPDNKRLHLSTTESVWAPLIRASSDNVILPVFGLDINPFLFLLTDLRGKYPGDWSEAANRRERRWIEELRELFPPPRWKTGANAKLRRGSRVVTDIDFWAMDTNDASVALFQLKWQQPVGMDNRARRSAGKNLVNEGNKWIEAVSTWLDENGLGELSRTLGLRSARIGDVRLFVVARYNAWFAGFDEHATAAVWSDWNHLMKVRFERPSGGVIELQSLLVDEVAAARASIKAESYMTPIQNLALILNPSSVPA